MSFARIVLLTLLLMLLGGNSFTSTRQRETIDVVFCLDLSGSTNGLIDDVRERMWEIINQVNSYRPAPEFRIGVVGFSRPSFGAKNSYVKVLQDLTSDFDLLAHELYNLKPSIEKGDQMVGEALKVSIRKMDWSENKNGLKVIYLIGNGMVNMGMSNYRDACELAVKEGITINTVYCRTRNNTEKELPGWREIARLAGGEQYDIRIHKRTPLVMTSADRAEFRELAANLSATYLYFGRNGRERYKMMAAIDQHAMASNEMTYESRVFYKISDRYQFHQQSWDLIDYMKAGSLQPELIEMQFLADSLKFTSPDKVISVAQGLKQKRSKTIVDLRRHLPYDRQAIINRMLEDRAIDKADIFERVIINSLNSHASDKGFSTGANASIEFRR
jgi:Mg-chelatase subunit ChlD